MAIKLEHENYCVGCETCMGCGRKADVYEFDALECDRCGCEVDTLYVNGDEQICAECLLSDYEEITEDNYERYLDLDEGEDWYEYEWEENNGN